MKLENIILGKVTQTQKYMQSKQSQLDIGYRIQKNYSSIHRARKELKNMEGPREDELISFRKKCNIHQS